MDGKQATTLAAAANPFPRATKRTVSCRRFMEPQGLGRGQLAPDRQFVWSGSEWRPVIGWRWQPTTWTRPMQLAVGAFFVFQAVLSLALLLAQRSALRDVMLRQMQRQLEAQPNPPDAQVVNQLLDVAFGLTIGFAILISTVTTILGVLTLLQRWAWLFYTDLVLLGIGMLGILNAFSSLAQGYPPSLVVPGALFAVVSAALFAWLLYARIRHGV